MPFPVATKQVEASVQGITTDVILSKYVDQILIVVTQTGTMGTILKVRPDDVPGGDSIFTVEILMGKRDEPLLVACARNLAEQMRQSGSTQPLVLSLGLKDHSPSTMREIIDVVLAHRVW